jgi:hypothetical protein
MAAALAPDAGPDVLDLGAVLDGRPSAAERTRSVELVAAAASAGIQGVALVASGAVAAGALSVLGLLS